jgi:hypothetical protein
MLKPNIPKWELWQEGVTFFVGAGASCPYGFPTGSGLVGSIINSLSNPSETLIGKHLLAHSDYTKEGLTDFADLLHSYRLEVETESIDDFFHINRDTSIREICRYATFCTILHQEQQYLLNRSGIPDWLYMFFVPFLVNFSSPDEFVDALNRTSNTSWEKVLGIHFISLNYDRMIEQRLLEILRAHIPNQGEILEIIKGRFHYEHPHGSLWTISDLPFGATLPEGKEALNNTVKRLAFWCEKSNKPEAWGIQNALVPLRGTLCFLGYGFHEIINDRFDPEHSSDSKLSKVVATTYGIKDQQRRSKIQEWICDYFSITPTNILLGEEGEDCKVVISKLLDL